MARKLYVIEHSTDSGRTWDAEEDGHVDRECALGTLEWKRECAEPGEQYRVVAYAPVVRRKKNGKKVGGLTVSERRASYEKKHDIPALGEAKCDECPELAYTRWYEGDTVKIAATLCKPCEEVMFEENRKNRERLGL